MWGTILLDEVQLHSRSSNEMDIFNTEHVDTFTKTIELEQNEMVIMEMSITCPQKKIVKHPNMEVLAPVAKVVCRENTMQTEEEKEPCLSHQSIQRVESLAIPCTCAAIGFGCYLCLECMGVFV